MVSAGVGVAPRWGGGEGAVSATHLRIAALSPSPPPGRPHRRRRRFKRARPAAFSPHKAASVSGRAASGSGPAGQGMAAPCGRPGLPAPPPPPAGPGPSSAPGPRVCFAAGPDGADGAAVGAEEAAGARRGGKVTVRYDRRELRKRLHLEEWILGQLTALYDCRVRRGGHRESPGGGGGSDTEGHAPLIPVTSLGPAPNPAEPFRPRPKGT